MYKININESQDVALEINKDQLIINNQSVQLDINQLVHGEYSVIVDNKSHTIFLEAIDRNKKTITLKVNGNLYTAKINEPIDLLLANMGLDLSKLQKTEPIKAPMPGLVLKILVEEGQILKKGDPVLILEAMKMENVFKTPTDATVKSILVTAGKAVEKGEILIDLE